MNNITPYLLQYGYLAVFVIILLEDFGMPLPGETALIAAGILAGKGHFSILIILLVAFLGAVIGDNIGYVIGLYGGRRLVLRYGGYVFIKEKHLAAIEIFFKRYGNEVVAFARFFNGARQLNGIIAGIGNMVWYHFLLFNIIGAALWVGVWGSLAYFVGRKTRGILAVVTQFETELIYLAAIALILYVGVRFLRKRAKHTK